MNGSDDRAYSLSLPVRLLSHGPARRLFVGDRADSHNLEVDALVASGDCFVTLATVLDQLHHSLEAAADHTLPELEKVIRTLLYLQRHYTITRQHPNYRQ
jgi:hypothetical protein